MNETSLVYNMSRTSGLTSLSKLSAMCAFLPPDVNVASLPNSAFNDFLAVVAKMEIRIKVYLDVC